MCAVPFVENLGELFPNSAFGIPNSEFPFGDYPYKDPPQITMLSQICGVFPRITILICFHHFHLSLSARY